MTGTLGVCFRAYEKAEDGVHYCEERFLEVARRFGVLGMPARHVSLEEAFTAHASQAWAHAWAGRSLLQIWHTCGSACHSAVLD